MSNSKDMWMDDIPVEPLMEGHGSAFLRNSVFRNNTAAGDNGGVANLGEYASVSVQGEGNLFEGNQALLEGGVFSAATTSVINVDGGEFADNESEEVRREAMPRGRGSADRLDSVLAMCRQHYRWCRFCFGHPAAWNE